MTDHTRRTIATLLLITTVLLVSCEKKQEEKSASTTPTALEGFVAAAKAGDLNRVKELLQSGIDVNAQTKDKEFALLSAITEKRDDVARYLLQNGANPDLVDISGQSPALFAAYLQNVGILQDLIDHKANVDIPTTSGETALFRAVAWQNRTIVTILMRAGADPNHISDEVLRGVNIKSRDEWNKLVKDLTD